MEIDGDAVALLHYWHCGVVMTTTESTLLVFTTTHRVVKWFSGKS
jgi:hypothetical protein